MRSKSGFRLVLVLEVRAQAGPGMSHPPPIATLLVDPHGTQGKSEKMPLR